MDDLGLDARVDVDDFDECWVECEDVRVVESWWEGGK